MIEGQQRLVRLAPEAVTVQAAWEGSDGWRLVLRVRRGDETWETAHRGDYERLTSAELCDVICAELDRLLLGPVVDWRGEGPAQIPG